jgi:hypothetical protein
MPPGWRRYSFGINKFERGVRKRMERKEFLERKERRIERRRDNDERRLGMVFGIVGGIALIGIAALVAVTLPDIKRYIKISTM